MVFLHCHLCLAFAGGGVFESASDKYQGGKLFLLTAGAFLLTVKLLCLQSLKALTRRTFPL